MRTVKYEFLSKFRPPRKLFKAATIDSRNRPVGNSLNLGGI